MGSKRKFSCSTCNRKTPHVYSDGWWTCKKCGHKIKNENTNKKNGHGRDYEASGAAHNKIAKGSYNQARRNYR